MSDDAPAPIPLRLSCPACGIWHIDEGDLATTPHRTHACQHCGALWAPAVVPTVGVKFLPGCKNEVVPDPAEARAAPAVLVAGHDPAHVTLTWAVYLAMREKLARLEAAQTETAHTKTDAKNIAKAHPELKFIERYGREAAAAAPAPNRSTRRRANP